MKISSERLLTPNELAELLGVSVSWIYQRTRLGQKAIPFLKVGKYVRFDPEEVLVFLRASGTGSKGIGNGVS